MSEVQADNIGRHGRVIRNHLYISKKLKRSEEAKRVA